MVRTWKGVYHPFLHSTDHSILRMMLQIKMLCGLADGGTQDLKVAVKLSDGTYGEALVLLAGRLDAFEF